MSKLTPWFPGRVKPVRAGYYERDWIGTGNSSSLPPDFWTGRAWRNVYRAHPMGSIGKSAQDLPWRGLAKKP